MFYHGWLVVFIEMRKIYLFVCVLVFVSALFEVLCRDVEHLYIYFILYMFLCYS
jgi:hypothetical protein